MRLTREQIQSIIPHRDPFLYIDEMIELESLHKGVGIKYVSPDEAFFKGHFPGKPVMPGVLIIESLAQVGAVILLSHPDYAGKIAYFAGISNAKFRKSVIQVTCSNFIVNSQRLEEVLVLVLQKHMSMEN